MCRDHFRSISFPLGKKKVRYITEINAAAYVLYWPSSITALLAHE